MYRVSGSACAGYLLTVAMLAVVMALLLVPPGQPGLRAFHVRLREPQEGAAMPEHDAPQESVTAPQLGPVDSIFVLRVAPHEWSHLSRARFRRMSAELGADRVFLLVDDTRLPDLVNGTRLYGSRWAPGHQLLLVKEAECMRASHLHQGLWYSPHTAMALFHPYLEAIDFKYVWFVEWDVDCWGKYTACFELPGFDHDLIMVYLAKFNRGMEWHWWIFLTGEKAGLPLKARWKSFFPVVRFSKRFLLHMYKDMRKSSGYCEVYIPTLCGSIPNCTLANLPDSKLGKFDYVPGQPGHQCWRPQEKDNKLYHPCKGNR